MSGTPASIQTDGNRDRTGPAPKPDSWQLLRRVVLLLALAPLLLIVKDAAMGGLGAEPVEALLHRTGWWALVLLIATLAITPVRRLTGWNRLIQLRRGIGLFAFFYACLHLLVYVAVDQWFGFSYILEDLLERPFITVGALAFLLLVPLAATSTRNSIRRLGGARWRRLHRLVYPAAALAILHFAWLVKADLREPLFFAALLIVLLALRLPRLSLLRKTSGSTGGSSASGLPRAAPTGEVVRG